MMILAFALRLVILLRFAKASLLLVSQTSSQIPVSFNVEYNCEFHSLWTIERHPNRYPLDSRWSGWTPIALVSHNEGYNMWGSGLFASAGVEQLAEIGDPVVFLREITAAGDSIGQAVCDDRRFQGEGKMQQQVLAVDADHPFVSAMSRIDPSPDWFSGFSKIDFRETATGTWFDSLSFETFPWDAGTETGNDYNWTNPPEDPHQAISQLTKDTIPKDTQVFLSPDGSTVLPVAQWTCVLVTSTSSIAPSMAASDVETGIVIVIPSFRPPHTPSPTLSPSMAESATESNAGTGEASVVVQSNRALSTFSPSESDSDGVTSEPSDSASDIGTIWSLSVDATLFPTSQESDQATFTLVPSLEQSVGESDPALPTASPSDWDLSLLSDSDQPSSLLLSSETPSDTPSMTPSTHICSASLGICQNKSDCCDGNALCIDYGHGTRRCTRPVHRSNTNDNNKDQLKLSDPNDHRIRGGLRGRN